MPELRKFKTKSKTRKFLKTNKQSVAASDKTNRLVITDTKSLDNGTMNIFSDDKTYKRIEKSRKKLLKIKLTKFFESIFKLRLPKNQSEKNSFLRLTACKFSVFVKDHKEKLDEGYPLRPIASAVNTAMEKVDWLVSTILGELTQFVPANLYSSTDLIEILNNMDKRNLTASFLSTQLACIRASPSTSALELLLISPTNTGTGSTLTAWTLRTLGDVFRSFLTTTRWTISIVLFSKLRAVL